MVSPHDSQRTLASNAIPQANGLLGGALLVEDIVGALAHEGLTETTLTAGRERPRSPRSGLTTGLDCDLLKQLPIPSPS